MISSRGERGDRFRTNDVCVTSLQLVNDGAIYHDADGERVGGRRGAWKFR